MSRLPNAAPATDLRRLQFLAAVRKLIASRRVTYEQLARASTRDRASSQFVHALLAGERVDTHVQARDIADWLPLLGIELLQAFCDSYALGVDVCAAAPAVVDDMTVAGSLGGAMSAVGALATEVTEVLADGKVTPEERVRVLARAEAGVRQLRGAAAKVAAMAPVAPVKKAAAR